MGRSRNSVEFSPNFDDYAAGRIAAHQIICVLCKTSPCSCGQCDECGWTIPPGRSCPRGH